VQHQQETSWGLTQPFRLIAILQVDDMRGSPLTVGSLEEIIDEK
jgi:hypothetical protein